MTEKLKDIKVRLAIRQDVKKVSELYQGWVEFRDILPPKLTEPDSVEDLIRWFGETSVRLYIIAVLEDTIVGVCYLDKTFESYSSIRLGDMFVQKDYRNQGIGASLIDYVIEYSKKNRIKKIWLWTQEDLTNAVTFYKQRGFILEGKQKVQFCGKDALLFGLVLE